MKFTAFAQGRDQLSDQLVRPGDAAIIRTAGILRGVPAWRLVWCVEIVKMDPGEKVGPAFQPSNRFGRDRIARQFKRAAEHHAMIRRPWLIDPHGMRWRC